MGSGLGGWGLGRGGGAPAHCRRCMATWCSRTSAELEESAGGQPPTCVKRPYCLMCSVRWEPPPLATEKGCHCQREILGAITHTSERGLYLRSCRVWPDQDVRATKTDHGSSSTSSSSCSTITGDAGIHETGPQLAATRHTHCHQASQKNK